MRPCPLASCPSRLPTNASHACPNPGPTTMCVLSRLFVSDSATPMDCSSSGSSVHGTFQATILACVAIAFSRGSSQPRDRTHISCITGRFFTAAPPGRTHSASLWRCCVWGALLFYSQEREWEKICPLLQKAAFPTPTQGIKWVEWRGGQGWGVGEVCLPSQALPGFRTSEWGNSVTALIPGRTGGSLLPGEGVSSPANQRSGLRFSKPK